MEKIESRGGVGHYLHKLGKWGPALFGRDETVETETGEKEGLSLASMEGGLVSGAIFKTGGARSDGTGEKFK